MIKIKYLMATTILSLGAIGCSGSVNTQSEQPPSYIYNNAGNILHDGNVQSTIQKLETFCNRYPYGPYIQQAQINLIYAYYKNDNLSMALELIDRFIRANPDHKNIDYVIYIRGLTNMARDKNFLQDFIGINRSDRDLIYTKNALQDFKQLLQNYPKSTYAEETKKHLSYLRERQAQYELSIAEFYSQRKAYLAVINRVEGILRDYPNTKAIHQALPLMEHAYRQLKLPINTYQADKS
ncbi:Outer membrane protein assembly factor BamD [Candidatus Erwinia haradaeae]|uniref:Outer membrane protein assembly factor BamD n=1 Tax=Candidatus Erwinia haradaeae TaxID=1922217 RepID=A0A451CZ98_9GAMM|nr:outer membrane protein assembly factor BamD [Candidatus Erwinia haradaeae]VFP78718.1 Outer membrane protein assembly factor BamD [Candidatus Erwinia haradaeae]